MSRNHVAGLLYAALVNALGLHDVLVNVSEWTRDCWNERYAVARGLHCVGER